MKIYMFHYVLKNFDYHHFDADLFEKKIQEIVNQYSVISLMEYDEIQKSNKSYKNKYVMLTFDDGTIDHYNVVYKILKKYNCSGLFFISSNIFNHENLDIQILHQLLSLNKFDEMYEILLNNLKEINYLINDNHLNYSLDNEKVATFKQLLQYKLPYKIRKKIINILIKKYNIPINYDKYYMNLDMIKEMKNNNMYFGIHTNTHPNLGLLKYEEQYKEINDNLIFLKENNLIENDLISIAYPYGIYNEDTLKILNELNVKYGFKAFVTEKKSNYEIDRIDCNVLREK